MMKVGDVYIHRKGHIFKVVRIYDGPCALTKELWSGDGTVDTIENWEKEKMKKLDENPNVKSSEVK